MAIGFRKIVAVDALVPNDAIEMPCSVVPASSDRAPWAVGFPVTAAVPAPPTSCRRKSTAGISALNDVRSPDVGSTSRTSRFSTRCCSVLTTSTTGVSPVTVIVLRGVRIEEVGFTAKRATTG